MVAVKLINLDLRADREARTRFSEEIAAARLVAPFCTAQILAAEVEGDMPYVVSEFITGTTLFRQVADKGPIAGPALDRLAIGTATALAAIHRADVVHCDFKPDNVILGPDGPRVIDFGIAQALDATQTATVRGAPPYMAPERFSGGNVGPAADVFAWGATIAYAASGAPPFGRDAMATVMHRVLTQEPTLEGLHDDLETLVRQCLSKDPADRPTAQQLLLRLLQLDSSLKPTGTALLREAAAVAVPRRSDRHPALSVWGLVVSLGLGGAGFGLAYPLSPRVAIVTGGAAFLVSYVVRLVLALWLRPSTVATAAPDATVSTASAVSTVSPGSPGSTVSTVSTVSTGDDPDPTLAR
jgi:serine/threonine protein kinase